ncbi:proline-rich protein 15-like protein A [Hippoglossus hippoglossus]|uniref:proline-rich protein 15-like protein A n=1 Tax=Hippoglossus hippoglossus TaxID=8267 RepID=UPI00148B4632|nr:proline-rich protein 15-like protein A [Hippoglossus hippoglossus]
MTDSSSSWWNRTFLRKQTSKDLYEIPAEFVSNATTGQQGAATGAAAQAEVTVNDSQLDNRLERILDKTTPSKGRHVKVSHSGRFKEKKKVRATLVEKPETFTEGDPARNENKKARK